MAAKTSKNQSGTDQDKMQTYFKPVDIWAAGVVLYSMVMGKLPFNVNKDDRRGFSTKETS